MEENTTPELKEAESVTILQPLIADTGTASQRDTLQKNKDSILGDTKVAPSGSLFIASVRVTAVGDGSTVNFPALGHKTGVLYIVEYSDPGGATTPPVMKLIPAIEGYFFYVYYLNLANGDALQVDPSITGTTINGSSSVLDVISQQPVIFIAADNGWYTIYN